MCIFPIKRDSTYYWGAMIGRLPNRCGNGNSQGASLPKYLDKEGAQINNHHGVYLIGNLMPTQHQNFTLDVIKEVFHAIITISNTLSIFWRKTILPSPRGFSWIQMLITLKATIGTTTMQDHYCLLHLNAWTCHRNCIVVNYPYLHR